MLLKLCIVVWCVFYKLCWSQRRILSPRDPLTDKPYMVYLVRSTESIQQATGWLCGGVIVHPFYVLTSASCVYDVINAYVISGYRLYVGADDLDEDKCTSQMKKRVVYVCAHNRYMWHQDLQLWATAEIGFARVETPFDYRDRRYLDYCSYLPKAITMSFFAPAPGEEAMVLGWGHNKFFRPEDDDRDYNLPVIQYSTVRITSPKTCMKAYSHADKEHFLENILDLYAICAESDNHTIDSNGKRLQPVEPQFGDSIRERISNLGDGNVGERKKDKNGNDNLQNAGKNLHVASASNSSKTDDMSRFEDNGTVNTRRGGICQNDHGGPLIVFRGGRELVVGISTLFMVKKNMQCVGPFVFSSLHCVSQFVKCMLPDLVNIRSDLTVCTALPEQRGYDLYERNMSWPTNGTHYMK